MSQIAQMRIAKVIQRQNEHSNRHSQVQGQGITRKRKSNLVYKAELYKIIDKKNSVNQIKETINIE